MGAPFNSIVCGVEGNPSSTEAARQAIALAGKGGGDLRFTAVYTSFELGPDYHKATLQESLEEAARLAAEAGVSADYGLREAKYASDVLLPEAADHDLLVIGTHGHSRATGILFGSTARKAAHRTKHPLLVARPAPGSDPFPQKILVASDGSGEAAAAGGMAAAIAAAFDSELELVHVADGKHDVDEDALEGQREEIAGICEREPGVDRREGQANKEIVDAAEEMGASLLVAGRRGLRGIKSLGSVSERIASGAPCSVLLVPAAAD